MKTAHIIVSGRVQGVGFRFFTKYTAENFGINGWVRNLDDGTVEIKATGKDEKIKEFLKEIKKGSPLSEVKDVNVKYEPLEEFNSFEII